MLFVQEAIFVSKGILASLNLIPRVPYNVHNDVLIYCIYFVKIVLMVFSYYLYSHSACVYEYVDKTGTIDM